MTNRNDIEQLFKAHYAEMRRLAVVLETDLHNTKTKLLMDYDYHINTGGCLRS